MDPRHTFVVVARHKEDTAWTQRLAERGFHVAVYDHAAGTAYPYAVPFNRGREASTYLKYIVDHYDSLQRYTAFVHGEERSWHHDGSLVDRIVTTNAQRGYRSLNNRCMSSILSGNDKLPLMTRFFKRYLEPYIGKMSAYGDWTDGVECCAQFIVHRNRITRFPKRFYQDLYSFVTTPTATKTATDDKLAGHMLEWTFNLIFDNPFLDHKLTPQQHAKRLQARATRERASCRKIR